MVSFSDYRRIRKKEKIFSTEQKKKKTQKIIVFLEARGKEKEEYTCRAVTRRVDAMSKHSLGGKCPVLLKDVSELMMSVDGCRFLWHS
jgi:hypothetical protein